MPAKVTRVFPDTQRRIPNAPAPKKRATSAPPAAPLLSFKPPPVRQVSKLDAWAEAASKDKKDTSFQLIAR